MLDKHTMHGNQAILTFEKDSAYKHYSHAMHTLTHRHTYNWRLVLHFKSLLILFALPEELKKH
jgi:hypothetical protein